MKTYEQLTEDNLALHNLIEQQVDLEHRMANVMLEMLETINYLEQQLAKLTNDDEGIILQ